MALGFFTALFSAGIGIGGGMLLVSILMSAFGFDFKKAARISLTTIIPIAFVGSANHLLFLPESPHLEYFLIFIPACVAGTLIGARMLQKRQNGWLKLIFSLFLLIISLKMLKIVDFPSFIYNGLRGVLFFNEWFLIVPVGIFIGIMAVSLGIGCGLLIVPFFVTVIDLNMHEAIALSLAAMFFLTVSAAIPNSHFKKFDGPAIKSLFIPAMAGATVGALISSNLPGPVLKKLFGIFLFVIAWGYIVQETALRVNLETIGIGKPRGERIKKKYGHIQNTKNRAEK